MTWRSWKLIAALGGLVAFLLGVLRRGSPWRGRAEKAQERATAAQHEDIDAKAALAKENVTHDAEKDAAVVGGQSTGDLYDEALDKLGLRRPGTGPGD